jgi:uncharacterized protein YjbJ (UPF0337 family)
VQEAHPVLQLIRNRNDICAELPVEPVRFCLNFKRIFFMNKDQVEGAVKDLAGKVQEKTGEAIGSTDQQAKGLVKQAEGKVQKAYGDVKEALKNPKDA